MDDIKKEKLSKNKKIFIIIFLILILIFNCAIGIIIHTRKDIDKFNSLFEDKTEIISLSEFSGYINNDLYSDEIPEEYTEDYTEEYTDSEY